MKNFIDRLNSCLNELILRKAEQQNKGTVKYNGDVTRLVQYKKMCDVYHGLADPDALALIPEILDVFEKKKEEIHNLTFRNPEKEDDLLIYLSFLRKQLGFDERERKVRYRRS